MAGTLSQRVRRLLIEGRVQGVGFRWFTRERARRRGLRGWVKNRPEGSVEVLVCGHDDVVADFLAELRQGPRGAEVSAVHELRDEENPVDPESLPYPFHIQRQTPV